jgi:hypothetical protein
VNQPSARTDVETERSATLALLRRTREATRRLQAELDPDAVVHVEAESWRVRDVVGHLAIWNGEAAHSLAAHASGGEHACVDSPGRYDEYNALAVRKRRAWPIDRVWSEYEATHDELEAAVEAMPAARWDAPALYPWNERGTVVGLVVVMTDHETTDHREPIFPKAS